MRELEKHCEWTSDDMRDPAVWTETFDKAEQDEIDAALRAMRRKSDDFLQLSKDDFPLPTLEARIAKMKEELVNGRGVVRIRGVDRKRYHNTELCLIYWGIGAHLGTPWAQNAKGHVLGDVTDHHKEPGDPTARGNEIGGSKLPFHCDGSDLVGLLCLDAGAEGGLSRIANCVSLHNILVRERPDLAEVLYGDLPYDYRGEQRDGAKPYYMAPGFTDHDDRLFMRLIPPYIWASQRHPEAPRLSKQQMEAITWINDTAESGRFNVEMAFDAGDMQFINNYHVLHGRASYEDKPRQVRHLKRLWLETDAYASRPAYFFNKSHWNETKTISRMDVAAE